MKYLLMYMLLFCYASKGHSQQILTIDGDTFKLFDNHLNKFITYRIANIDAPEKTQLFGIIASNVLDSILHSGIISLKIFNVDKYGRTIALPYINSFRVDSFMVSIGLAFVFYKYSSDDVCINAEFFARSNRFYVWSIPNYIKPWEWRKIKKTLPKVKFLIPFIIH